MKHDLTPICLLRYTPLRYVNIRISNFCARGKKRVGGCIINSTEAEKMNSEKMNASLYLWTIKDLKKAELLLPCLDLEKNESRRNRLSPPVGRWAQYHLSAASGTKGPKIDSEPSCCHRPP